MIRSRLHLIIPLVIGIGALAISPDVAHATACSGSTPQTQTYYDAPADTTGTDITAVRVTLDATCHITLTDTILNASKDDTYLWYLDADNDTQTGQSYVLPMNGRVAHGVNGIDAAVASDQRSTLLDLNAIPAQSGQPIALIAGVFGRTIDGTLYSDYAPDFGQSPIIFTPVFTTPAAPTTGGPDEPHTGPSQASAGHRPHRDLPKPHRPICLPRHSHRQRSHA